MAAYTFLERRAIKFTRRFQGVQMAPASLIEHKDEYYVTDTKGNRILVFNRQGKLQRTIRAVGSGPGELLRPAEFAISKDDFIYVLEGGNERIQIMTLEAKYVNHFPIGYTQGFAINSKGEIFLGQPEKGELISVYSRRGQLIKSFGDLRKISDFYGQAYVQKNKLYELLINRVDICIDHFDNVYVTFRFAPVLQKYDPNGRLLWEARLQGPDIDTLVSLFLTDEKNRKFIRVGTDGQHANLVLLNAVVNPRTGNICVLLPNKVLYVLDGQGKHLESFNLIPADPKDRNVWPEVLTLNASGEIVLIDPSRCVLLKRGVENRLANTSLRQRELLFARNAYELFNFQQEAKAFHPHWILTLSVFDAFEFYNHQIGKPGACLVHRADGRAWVVVSGPPNLLADFGKRPDFSFMFGFDPRASLSAMCGVYLVE